MICCKVKNNKRGISQSELGARPRSLHPKLLMPLCPSCESHECPVQKDPMRKRSRRCTCVLFQFVLELDHSDWLQRLGVMLHKPPHLGKVTPRCPLILTRKLRVVRSGGFEASQVNIGRAGGVGRGAERRPDSASE